MKFTKMAVLNVRKVSYMISSAAFLSGLLFAFSLYRYLLPPHIHMLGVQFFPLILLFTEQWLDRPRALTLVLLATCLILQTLNSAYLLFAVALLYAPFLALAVWRARATFHIRRLLGLLAVGCIVGGVLFIAMRPYLVLRAYGLVPSYSDTKTSLGLIPLFARVHLRAYLFDQGVGWIGYLLGAVAVLFGRGASARWVRLVGLMCVSIGCIAALGPHGSAFGVDIGQPYAFLMRALPGFSSVRLPARFTVIAHLGFALLAGYGFHVLIQRGRSFWLASVATVLVSVAILASYRPYPELAFLEPPVAATVPRAYKWLRLHGQGGALLELPRRNDYAGRAVKAYLSTFHWLPIVDGYADNAPAHTAHLHWIAKRLPTEAALQELVDLADIRWILVHRDQLSGFDRELWKGQLPPGLSVAGEWNDDLLLEVSQPVRNDRRGRLLSSSVTLNGQPFQGKFRSRDLASNRAVEMWVCVV